MMGVRKWSDMKWLIGILCLAGAIASSSAISYASAASEGYESNDNRSEGSDPSGHHSDIYEDLIWLIHRMDEIGNPDMSLTVLGYGQIRLGDESPASVMRSLLTGFDGAEYTTAGDTEIGSVTLSDRTMLSATVQKYSHAEALVAIKLVSSQLERLTDYQKWFARMTESGTGLSWRLNVQSTFKGQGSEGFSPEQGWRAYSSGEETDGTGSDQDRGASGLKQSGEGFRPERVWEALEAHGAVIVHDGEYRDAGSVSRTFHVPYLSSATRVRDQLVNLQAAVHQSTMDGSYRVTLGTPLITVEY